MDIEYRLLAKIRVTAGGCFEWTGAKSLGGYGTVGFKRKTKYAHRVSYEVFCGPIAAGLQVLHRCDNPSCINPAHLFAGTAKQNSEDCAEKGRNCRGSRFWRAKLKEYQIPIIAQRFASGETCSQIARSLGVRPHTVSQVVRGNTWKHIPRQVFVSSKIDGAKHPTAKLWPEQVREIRQRHEGGESTKALAAAYGVKSLVIDRAIKRQTYKDVA